MIRFVLPTLNQEIVNGELVETYGEIKGTLDLTINCQLKWEESFPSQAQKFSLFDYIENIKNDEKASALSKTASMLKAIYCFMDFDDPIDFKQFSGMISFNNYDYCEKLIKKINDLFNVAFNISKKKS